jgi:nitrate reductase (NAD(P)H)
MEDPGVDSQGVPEAIEKSIKQQPQEVSPPTPPLTDDERSYSSTDVTDSDIPLPPLSSRPTKVLDVDLRTPDAHVLRDPRLIRLTGVHPFNVEAPLTDLFNEGFLTSPELFYVRNHGAVPEVRSEEILDWEFMVEGLVENPVTLTLRQLIGNYEQITCPITLVCAGNRRKEQNVVRKTKGFSWGAAGVSTALWTGVALPELLRRAKPKRNARFVCMEGADKLPNGYYGTSVKLNWAMDPNRGMMLAYNMNGEMLTPDHGKPLRVVIPGQIGGRSVKWLKRLIITEQPSDNWYHIYDNRVLPTTISPEQSANEPKWWMDERYAIYDLNPNSAICQPAHNERIPMSNGQSTTYRARGYAYSGGGRRVTRVEVTLNKGATWELADIEYHEDRYRDVERDLCGGRLDMRWRESCFCWCFWSIDISRARLQTAKDIFVRCMDDSMNIQPRDMYWSVLGMMNNPWFRVTISVKDDSLVFEHPTQPALIPGGWMEKVKKAGGDLTNGYWGETLDGTVQKPTAIEPPEEVVTIKPDLKQLISIDDLRKHDGAKNPWFVLNGEVYDGTAFLEGHPGGAQSIISSAGIDATEEFMAIHSENAKGMMPDYHIGTLDTVGKAALLNKDIEVVDRTREIFLQPKSWSTAILHSKKIVSWDTRIFTFKLDHPAQRLGLPVGQHLMVRLQDPALREVIIRSYTPISEVSQQGYMDMLVKVYFATNESMGGKMSLAMDSLPIGHFIEMKGPIGKFEYTSRGSCVLSGKKRQVRSFVMICGGSGVTPIYQVFRAVMQDEDDKTTCVVFDGNRQLEDILCKQELDDFAKGNEDKCKIFYTLTKADESWTGARGRITGEMVKEHCSPDKDTLVLICGPEAMEKSMHKALLEQGWDDNQLVFF